MNMMLRHWLAAPIVVGAVGLVSTTAADVATARSNPRTPVSVAVVDEAGAPRAGATVMACPYRHGTADCDEPIAAATNRHGVSRLRLDARSRYQFTAFVRDPAPPWACPGLEIDGSQYYFASDPFSARPHEVRRDATLMIVEPDPSDCAPPPATTARATVVDVDGNPLPTATTGLFICPLAADGTPCPGPSFDGPDPDGIIRFDVDPTVTYRLNAFYLNSGWPCPDYVAANGDTFHFSDITDHVGADLVTTTTTFVIAEPDPSECAPPPATTAQATVVDVDGNALPAATTGLFICPLAADGTPCPGPSFDGPDPDGIIRFDVDPTVTYRLNAFYVNSGWPCPDYVAPNGDTFHFSDITDHVGADLVTTTTTFVIEPGTCLVD